MMDRLYHYNARRGPRSASSVLVIGGSNLFGAKYLNSCEIFSL
jgi:hypothetical protein